MPRSAKIKRLNKMQVDMQAVTGASGCAITAPIRPALFPCTSVATRNKYLLPYKGFQRSILPARRRYEATLRYGRLTRN